MVFHLIITLGGAQKLGLIHFFGATSTISFRNLRPLHSLIETEQQRGNIGMKNHRHKIFVVIFFYYIGVNYGYSFNKYAIYIRPYLQINEQVYQSLDNKWLKSRKLLHFMMVNILLYEVSTQYLTHVIIIYISYIKNVFNHLLPAYIVT